MSSSGTVSSFRVNEPGFCGSTVNVQVSVSPYWASMSETADPSEQVDDATFQPGTGSMETEWCPTGTLKALALPSSFCSKPSLSRVKLGTPKPLLVEKEKSWVSLGWASSRTETSGRWLLTKVHVTSSPVDTSIADNGDPSEQVADVRSYPLGGVSASPYDDPGRTANVCCWGGLFGYELSER